MKIAPVQKQTKAGQRTRFRVSQLALPYSLAWLKLMTKNPAF